MQIYSKSWLLTKTEVDDGSEFKRDGVLACFNSRLGSPYLVTGDLVDLRLVV